MNDPEMPRAREDSVAVSENAGTLYVVATPIGNLEDLSPRARRTLASVDLVAAEDTRHTRRLLTHFGVRTPLFALHEHNEDRASAALVGRLREGESVAIVSDAGTPLVSDPGYRLVRAAAAAGIAVSPVPGACAAIAALSAAGLATDSFLFLGFPPPKREARRRLLESLCGEPRTLVLYEAVHRCGELLADLVTVFGEDRPAVLARELTKQHETFHRGSAGDLASAWTDGAIEPRGEFVVCVGGAPAERADTGESERVLRLLLAELPVSTAARLAAEITGMARNDLYRQALEIRAENGGGA
jgi:16S rRNA (cytidine1402-2'-O)-methyltransferase